MGGILRVTSMYLGRQEAGTVELVWVVNVSLPPATLISEKGRLEWLLVVSSYLDNFRERRWNIVFNVGKRRQQKTRHCDQGPARRSHNPQSELILLKGNQGSSWSKG